MKPVLLLDVSRLIWRARRRGPTGIDRVELAYARHFLADEQARPVYAVLHLLGFVIALSESGGRRFVSELTARWEGSPPASRWANFRSVVALYARLLTSGWLFGPILRHALYRSGGTPVFLVVSHHHVARGYTIERIKRRLGARAVCLIHDLIPIDYPEYFKPGWERRYRRLVGNIGRYFDAVIANSESTARSLRTCLETEAGDPLRSVAIHTAPLGVRAFPAPARLSAEPSPYFVVLGTIEPRKNHLLLLNLWGCLAATRSAVPRLVVIGHRGWENEQVVDMLERSRRLRGLVEERNGLSDAEVGELLHGARALLLPSLAEGFGLPLGEALASGVPAICSDIAVFREVGGAVPEYLDPLDLKAWEEAVLDYSRPDSPRRSRQMLRLGEWQCPRWPDHFAAVEQLVAEVETADQEVLPAAAALAANR